MTVPVAMSYPIGDGLTIRIPPGARAPEPYDAGIDNVGIDNWDNEGGSLDTPFDRPEPNPIEPLPRPQRLIKVPDTTVSGCQERALADLAAAVAMDTQDGRFRLEHSAASWVKRANLLQKLDDGFDERHAVPVPEGEQEETLARAHSRLSI